MGHWCKRCDEYRILNDDKCGCKIIGKVWEPDAGETEETAVDVWSIHDPEIALQKWAETLDSNSCGEAFNGGQSEVTVMFRPAGSDEVETYNLYAELTLDYGASRV